MAHVFYPFAGQSYKLKKGQPLEGSSLVFASGVTLNDIVARMKQVKFPLDQFPLAETPGLYSPEKKPLD